MADPFNPSLSLQTTSYTVNQIATFPVFTPVPNYGGWGEAHECKDSP